MPFHLLEKRGVNRFWVSDDLADDKLSVHISLVQGGQRAHPPHVHDGVEAFFILEGQGALEIGDERIPLAANEGIVLNPATLHGLVNTGQTPLRYMVIIAR